MSIRDIRTPDVHAGCDVCGRTLLRGERAEIYLAGGTRRSVCELCKPRALHEGWVREGTVPVYDETDAPSDRRRSLLSRLRPRREAPAGARSSRTLEDELDGQSFAEVRPAPPRVAPAAPGRVREPRHVHAVPTSSEQKIVSAVDLFNGSEHRRTVAGVARSLGTPTVSVSPSGAGPSVVNVVVSWELCWYRYEIDLSDERPSVRVTGQGYELEELAPDERQPNASSDDHGSLSLAG